MFWNYRAVRHRYADDQERIAIHEAYYEDLTRPPARMVEVGTFDPEYPRPSSITEQPMEAETWNVPEDPANAAATLEGLREVLERMLLACDKPILEYKEFHETEGYLREST